MVSVVLKEHEGYQSKVLLSATSNSGTKDKFRIPTAGTCVYTCVHSPPPHI